MFLFLFGWVGGEIEAGPSVDVDSTDALSEDEGQGGEGIYDFICVYLN